MRTRLVALLLAAALVAYLVFAWARAWVLITSGDVVATGLGVAVLVIPAIGAWALLRELVFGFRMQELGHRLGVEGGLPLDDLPRTPSGRIDRDAADARFTRYQAEVEASPEDWRAWYRLAIGYDDARDRKRARRAMREAIRLSR